VSQLCWHGGGALKLLRTLYEQALTAAYLGKHPSEAEDFQDFAHIQEKKLLTHADRFDVFARMIPPERRARANELYEAHRAQFRQTPCPTCKRAPQISWTIKNTEQLAREAGEGWDVLYPPAFFIPTTHIHATPAGLFSQVVQRGVNSVFTGGSPENVDLALRQAHVLMLLVLRTHIEHFKLKHLHPELSELAAAFGKIWHVDPMPV